MDRTNVIGVAITGQTTAEVLERIRQAEQAGIPAAWMTTGGAGRDVAIPAIETGARKAGRPTPSLVAHAVVCVHENIAEVRTAAKEQLGTYPANPFYTQMFVDAGYPDVAQTKAWSNPMLDDVVLSGNGVRVRRRLQELLAFGAREIIVSIVTAGKAPAASYQRSLKVLAQASAPEASEEE
ncbi:MAG: hypothetical protein V1724_02510 [Chloroflexota bacterium]